MSLSKKKLVQYHKQCRHIENLYKRTGCNNKEAKQLAKQRQEAKKLLKMLAK